MKTIVPIGLAAAALACSSCVDPYYAGDPPAHHSSTVTTYRTGYEVRALPRGYRTEIIEGDRYYVHSGTYYRPRSGGYVVVEPPRRRTVVREIERGPRREVYITELPRGYRTITRRGVRYYQADGRYYRPRGSGYVMVETLD